MNHNVTPIAPRRTPQPVAIMETVQRAKQIVRAVRIAQEHESEEPFDSALEQVDDLLERACCALSELEDSLGRK